MDILITYVLPILIIINIIFLIWKLIIKKDISLAGPALARFVVLIGLCYYKQLNDLVFVHIAIGLVFISDIFVSLIYILSRKYSFENRERYLLTKITELEQKYDMWKETSPIGLYIISTTGLVEFVNAPLKKLLGYTDLELIGKPITKFIDGKYWSIVEDNIARRLNGEVKDSDYELELIAKSGQRIKVRVIGRLTRNGHYTITGSVIQIDEYGRYIWNLQES